MLNIEKYKIFLEKNGKNFGISKEAEIPFVCKNHLFTFIQKDCCNCKWRYKLDCEKSRYKWMMSEYTKTGLSKLEYDLLKFIKDNTFYKYLTRNHNGELELHFEAPEKYKNGIYRDFRSLNSGYLLDCLFSFVDYGDEQPTCISDILNDCEVIDDANN